MATMPRGMIVQIYKTTPTLLELLNRAPQRPSVTHAYCGNCPACKAWNTMKEIHDRRFSQSGGSPQRAFIEELAEKAGAEKASFITADKVDAMIREADSPDILSITRDVARGG
jgi:predicted ATP-dependent serine protease